MLRRVICALKREHRTRASPTVSLIEPRLASPPTPHAEPNQYSSSKLHSPTLSKHSFASRPPSLPNPIEAGSGPFRPSNPDTTAPESSQGVEAAKLAGGLSMLEVNLALRDSEVAHLRKRLERADALTSKLADQLAEIARLKDEVSSLNVREVQFIEDERLLRVKMKRKTTRIHVLTRGLIRAHTERAKLVTKHTLAKRRMKIQKGELEVAREASNRSQSNLEALQIEFDAYKEDQLHTGTKFERAHKELLQVHVAYQAEHRKSLDQLQAALDESSKKIILLEKQRGQDAIHIGNSGQGLNMLNTTLSLTELAAATTRERLSRVEEELVKQKGEYEKKSAEVGAAGLEITRLLDALTLQKHTHEEAVRQLRDMRASQAKLHEERLIERQGYESQLSRERVAFMAAVLEARRVARAESSSEEDAVLELGVIRQEMNNQVARERDAFTAALTRAQDDLHNTRLLLDVERRNYISLQEAHAQHARSFSKPIARVDDGIQTDSVTAEASTLQTNGQAPYALPALLQAYLAMSDLSISVAPNAPHGVPDQR